MNLTSHRQLEWGEDWRSDAACTGVDTNLFFPGGTTGDALLLMEEAKAICRSCPCCDACLAFAVETNQEFGVWGSASEEERRKLRRTWLAQHRPVS
jgi:WhiB family redox-sensing transcriptional regulator